MSNSVVAIVGRPNVGKSTLFNRILGLRDAIVHDVSGVTRDRKYAEAEWSGSSFTIIDTGGYVPVSDDVFERAIREQAEIAIDEADAVVFVVDALTGVLPLDKDIAAILRKKEKSVHLLVNKIDSQKREALASEFFELGLGDPIPISALAGRQVGDFLDLLVASLPKKAPAPGEDEQRLRIAVVGKPNVGKSSLVNALLGKNRQVVTDVPGTTRDPIDSILKFDGQEVVLVDTAGLKKKNRTKESLDFYSSLRTLKSIERCDVAVVLYDAIRGVDKQDLHIVETTVEKGKGLLIAVNKWDLVEKDTMTAEHYSREIRNLLGVHEHIPLVFVSALTKQRIGKILEVAKSIHESQNRRIATSRLNDTLLPAIKQFPPSSSSAKEIKIKYVTQVRDHPPVFAFFCNEPSLVPETYRRFLVNTIREAFGFNGVPIRVVFKQK